MAEAIEHVVLKLFWYHSILISTPPPNIHLSSKCLQFVACLETKGNKLLRSMNTMWTSMLGPTRGVQTLETMMVVDAPKEYATKKNLSMLLDWQNMQVTLPCLMPMLHFVNALIKFAQSPACYVVDFISTVKIC